MYDWRKFTTEEKRKVLQIRMDRSYPAHELPHFYDGCSGFFTITGTNYLHQKIVGKSSERMTDFSIKLKDVVEETDFKIHAYCLLPNHYHLLIEGTGVERLRTSLGKLHGRSSFYWNAEDGARGRKVWYRVYDDLVHSQRHFYTSLNYIHYNPLKDGYCNRMSAWPWSSARTFLQEVGLERATELWKTYPPKDSRIIKHAHAPPKVGP
jgi:putative transposase